MQVQPPKLPSALSEIAAALGVVVMFLAATALEVVL